MTLDKDKTIRDAVTLRQAFVDQHKSVQQETIDTDAALAALQRDPLLLRSAMDAIVFAIEVEKDTDHPEAERKAIQLLSVAHFFMRYDERER